MKLALVDCHWWNEPAREDNPYHHQEIQFGRHLNFTLASLLIPDVDTKRVSSDMHRPQTHEASMHIKAKECEGCDVALEPHFNNAPKSRHGFLVEAKRGDPESELFGSLLAREMAVAVGHTVDLVLIPDPDYRTSRLFDICPVPFVLVECGNLARRSIRDEFLEKRSLYYDVTRALMRGIKAFQEVRDGDVGEDVQRSS